jgi:hypothetical protein
MFKSGSQKTPARRWPRRGSREETPRPESQIAAPENPHPQAGKGVIVGSGPALLGKGQAAGPLSRALLARRASLTLGCGRPCNQRAPKLSGAGRKRGAVSVVHVSAFDRSGPLRAVAEDGGKLFGIRHRVIKFDTRRLHSDRLEYVGHKSRTQRPHDRKQVAQARGAMTRDVILKRSLGDAGRLRQKHTASPIRAGQAQSRAQPFRHQF